MIHIWGQIASARLLACTTVKICFAFLLRSLDAVCKLHMYVASCVLIVLVTSGWCARSAPFNICAVAASHRCSSSRLTPLTGNVLFFVLVFLFMCSASRRRPSVVSPSHDRAIIVLHGLHYAEAQLCPGIGCFHEFCSLVVLISRMCNVLMFKTG